MEGMALSLVSEGRKLGEVGRRRFLHLEKKY
ncbi:hypothetical protein FUSO6_06990 [Fusobacterium necrophorum DAB]|uniref:Uncharacterized protein n=1 Tax=Fusobacterium necrophorum BL TaxID=1441732 RepID=A0AB73BTS3_9FUSO|nr:hypothetical protein FUSO3_10650 [Fusobacterium necrophorum BL]KDE65233.1 hypothetical protein FUSO5_04835 [Fusobacterium necrophorum BFTR-1]KDE69321.1 hypothetical protein FUSO6_06990 [Fusobacterium necrophorum DAB]